VSEVVALWGGDRRRWW